MSPRALFAVWPYAALAVFAGGMAIRSCLAPRARAEDGFACVGSSAAALSRPRPRHGIASEALRGLPWRIGAALLAAGHLAGLFLPRAVLAWNASPARLYALEAVAFACGTSALLWWARRSWRQLRDREAGWAADLAETAFLSAVGVTLASGLAMAALYRWSSSWGAMILAPYTLSILRGQPVVELADQLPYLAQLHVAAACGALALAPWTPLGSFLARTLRRAVRESARPLAGARLAIEAWARRRNPAAWLWPDED